MVNKFRLNKIQEFRKEFKLEQNYPNPFNPSTTIKYSIPNVETRHASSLHLPGNYKVTFDASHSEQGRGMTSGVYFYTLSVGNYLSTKKLILMK